ncbi:fam-c protein [Plasmodium vinckei lentum]|uniref:Fam-c protein n=1 Tax=Plasmodium vinckei lentum TaxID=138297 RepID=A0A6V7S7I2_PLAVN|nr:fam-c protein [Plasmodium vinckei lentum]
MNKRIFSLVCIVLYVILAVSIHCSEQKNDRSKTSGLRSRAVRAIKKISGSSKKNDVEPQRENQSNNNNNKDNIKPINSKKYRNLSGHRKYCCGLCGDDEDPSEIYY